MWRRQKMIKCVAQEPNLGPFTSSSIREDNPYTQGGHIVGQFYLQGRDQTYMPVSDRKAAHLPKLNSKHTSSLFMGYAHRFLTL